MANLEWRIGRMPAFIVALALTAVGGPLAADAQQTRHPYRIGVVHAGFFPNTPPVSQGWPQGSWPRRGPRCDT